MYLPLRPLPLYGYSGCIHTPLMPISKNIFFGANTCGACICNPGEYRKILLANYLCIGFVPGDSVPLLKGPSKKTAQRKVAGPFAIYTPAISDYTPAVSDYTPAISDYTPITLTLFNFFEFNFEKLYLHLHFSIFLN